MHESVAISLSLPDGKRVFQRRCNDAPHSRGMLAMIGGGIEDDDLCSYTAASREFGEEVVHDSIPLEYIGYTFYISEVLVPPIARIHVYKGEVSRLPELHEGTGAETFDPDELMTRTDVATSTQYLLRKIQHGELINNTVH